MPQPTMEKVNAKCIGPSSKEAGKASSCQGCPNQATCSSGAFQGVDPALEQVRQRMSEVQHTLLVLSGKGGVGKSSISAQLAWELSEKGFQVGVLDIDICGPSMPRMMGIEDQEVHRSSIGWCPVPASDNLSVMSVGFMLQSNTDAVVWRGPRKTALIKQFLGEVDWNCLDFLIVDAPPGTSDEHISIAHYLQACNPDGALIVTTPQEIALLDVRKEINFCHKAGINVLGVIENMSGFVCPCCSHTTEIFPRTTGGGCSMAEQMKVPFLGSIPLDPRILQCCEEGKPFVPSYPDAPAAAAYISLIDKLLQSINVPSDRSLTQ